MNIDISPAAQDVNIGGYNVNKAIIAHIKEASSATGVNLKYLLAKAGQESGFETNAKSSGSSATGIYQFTERTWLQQFKLYGAKYGYKTLASKIYVNKDGQIAVKDKKSRKIILNLRKNPRMSSLLAAEFAKHNQQVLEEVLNIEVQPSDLYLAHFLGTNGAIKLLKAIKENSKQPANKLFPEAAKANYRIFFKSKEKKPRSVKEVYKFINLLFEKSISRFTNIPPKVFTSLAKNLPSDISIGGDDKRDINHIEALLKDQSGLEKFDISNFSIINSKNLHKVDFDFKDAFVNNNYIPKLPKHIASRMLSKKEVQIEDKNVSFPEINFINELIENIEKEKNTSI